MSLPLPDKELLALLAIIVSFTSCAPYISGIVRGETKPHMFSWLIWAVVCGTAGIVQLLAGGGPGSWILIVNSLYCFGVAVASYWRGTKDVTRSDAIILVLALSALPLGYMMKTLLLSTLIAVAIDGMGYIPTIRKSWHKPGEESALSWAFSAAALATSLLALDNYSVTTCLYPATFAIINAGLLVFLLVRRKMLAAKACNEV